MRVIGDGTNDGRHVKQRSPGIRLGVILALVFAILLGEGCAINRPQLDSSVPSSIPAEFSRLSQEASDALFQKKDLQRAQEKYQAALAQAKKLDNDRLIGHSLHGLGLVALARHEYTRAIETMLAADRAFQSARDVAGRALTLMSLGDTYRAKGDNANAISTYAIVVALEDDMLAKSPKSQRDKALSDRARVLRSKGDAYRQLSQWQKAVESYQGAAHDFRAVGDRVLAAHALMAAGDVLRIEMKSYQEAIIAYTEARDVFQQTGDVAQAIEALNNIGVSHYFSLNAEAAKTVFTEMLSLGERESLPGVISRSHFGLGLAVERLADFDEALSHYEVALQWSRKDTVQKTYPLLEPGILTSMADLLRVLSHYEQAVQYFLTASLKYREKQASGGEAEALTRAAEVLFWIGDYRAAIEYYTQALERYKSLKNTAKQIRVLASLGESTSFLGKNADRYFNEAYQLVKSLERVDLITLLSKTAEEGKEPRVVFEEWRKANQGLGYDYVLAVGILYQKWGRLLLLGGESDQAERLLLLAASYHNSLPLDRDVQMEQAKDLFFLSASSISKGDTAKALENLRVLEKWAERLRTPEIYWVYGSLGAVYAKLGNVEQAKHYYTLAISTVESVRGRQETEEFKGLVVEVAFGAYRGLVDLLIDHYVKSGDDQSLRDAFEYTERGRAQAFLEVLTRSRANRTEGELASLTAKQEAVRREIDRIYHRLRYVGEDRAEEERLLARLEVLRDEWRVAKQKAAQKDPRYAEFMVPRRVTISDVQSGLDRDSALLEYVIGFENVAVWVITREGVRLHQLPARTKDAPVLEAFLKTLREPLMESGESSRHVALGQQIYNALVAPLEPDIAGKSHLIIVPDGRLHYLPFEALISPTISPEWAAGRGLAQVPYLVKRFRVSYVPSAAVLLAQRWLRGKQRDVAQLPLVAFGDPLVDPRVGTRTAELSGGVGGNVVVRDADLRRLKFASEEVLAIARIFGIPENSDHINLRERATIRRLHELDLTRYRIVHFAVHAVLGDEVAWATQPALVLSPVEQDVESNGVLQFADILDLKLNADLVTLSACQTNLGELRDGEGLVGLTRAFMYAGAASVVVSLWKVEDQSTRLLMERFYWWLKNGVAKAEALRRAKLEILEAETDLRALGARQSLAPPFFWAGFVLSGDWE